MKERTNIKRDWKKWNKIREKIVPYKGSNGEAYKISLFQGSYDVTWSISVTGEGNPMNHNLGHVLSLKEGPPIAIKYIESRIKLLGKINDDLENFMLGEIAMRRAMRFIDEDNAKKQKEFPKFYKK